MQRPGPGGSDAADGDAERRADLLIGGRRVAHQHLQQQASLGRKLGQSGADRPAQLVSLNDALARSAGLMTAERGGVLVDEACRASAPDVYAVGECASAAGRCWGLVAPGYDQAAVVVDRLSGGERAFTGADLSTKLKLMGIDVASFGDALAETEHCLEIVYADPARGLYQKLVMTDDAKTLAADEGLRHAYLGF